MNENKHYVKLDLNNYIIKGFSDAFEQVIETDIYISEGGRHFELNGVINPSLFNNGVPIYKFIDDTVTVLSDADIQAYKASLPPILPTQEDRVTSLENAIAILMGV